MLLLGSLVNCLAIMAGSFSGIILRNITEQTKDTVTKGISLGVVALAIQVLLSLSSSVFALGE